MAGALARCCHTEALSTAPVERAGDRAPGQTRRFDLGLDCILGAGGGIHTHPMGPRAGAMAMRQAIDAVMVGESLQDAARQQPELRAALETWGVWQEESLQLFALR